MRRPLFMLGLLATLLMSGCDNAFDPDAPGDHYFALYGVLDGRRATQQIRVEDLAVSLNVPDQIDAQLTVRDLGSGEVSDGRDSLITLDDGERSHLFLVPFLVQPGGAYEVEVTRLGEPTSMSSARITVPSPWAVRVNTTFEQPPDSGQLLQRIVLLDGSLPLVGPVMIEYDVQHRGTGELHQFSFPRDVLTSTEGLVLSIELTEQVESIREALGVAPDDDQALALERVAIHYTRASTETSPVQQGVGAFGWITPFESPWVLDAETLALLGLVDAQGGGLGL
ncbi:MAG: hypothetical protein HKN04_11605 [Rhodothermaceae bacterium]|nr:hypothetical protein [Rhodothermaceae bacterium]